MTRTQRADKIREYFNDVTFYVNEGDAENAYQSARVLGQHGIAALKARANRQRAAGIRAAYESVGMVRTPYGWE